MRNFAGNIHRQYFSADNSFDHIIHAVSSFQVPELGDTIFIVLRKQKLIFLHWYHHITVLIYCWYSFSQYTAPARWFVVMNFIVHSIMYTYYAFRALR